ncbi:MAG: DUF4238 domain-containing protein [Terracidiphilus sp.]
MAKARPKQQHYVTRAYLDGFLTPGANQLVCYARNGKKFSRRTQDIAKERNFYAFKNEKGEWDDSLEEIIGRTVETPGLPVLQKLANGKTRLKWEDRTALAMLVAFQEVRTPASIQRTIDYTKAMTERLLREVRAANPLQMTIDLVGKDGKGNAVTLAEMEKSQADLENENSLEKLKLAMGPAMNLYQYYRQMKFTVYYSLGHQKFITTDTPVIRVYSHGGYGTGINRNDVEIRFPISSNAFLTITHDLKLADLLIRATEAERAKLLNRLPEVQIRYIRDAEVSAFNRGHVRHARMWVFSSQESDWIPDLLKEQSAAPTVVDLSSRDLYHFQSKVNYDPRIDAPNID